MKENCLLYYQHENIHECRWSSTKNIYRKWTLALYMREHNMKMPWKINYKSCGSQASLLFFFYLFTTHSLSSLRYGRQWSETRATQIWGGRKISRFIFSLFSHFCCIVWARRRQARKIINNKVISMLLPLILKFTAMPCCLRFISLCFFIPFKMSHSIFQHDDDDDFKSELQKLQKTLFFVVDVNFDCFENMI